jgi:hypothetical protein
MSVDQEVCGDSPSDNLKFEDVRMVLEAYGREIQAEHTLLSHRMTWYVTSQSFLFSAYAVSGSHGNAWGSVFMIGIPVLGILLSELARRSIWAAIEAQYDLIRNQKALLGTPGLELSAKERAVLKLLAKTTCEGRESKYSFHDAAMLPPLLIPILLMLSWPTFVFFRGLSLECFYNGFVIVSAALTFGAVAGHAITQLSEFRRISRFKKLNRLLKILKLCGFWNLRNPQRKPTERLKNDAEATKPT